MTTVDLVNRIQDEANRSGRNYELNAENYNKVIELFNYFGKLTKEYEGGLIDYDISAKHSEAVLRVSIESLTIRPNHKEEFLRMLSITDKAEAYPYEDDFIELRFAVNDLWKRIA